MENAALAYEFCSGRLAGKYLRGGYRTIRKSLDSPAYHELTVKAKASPPKAILNFKGRLHIMTRRVHLV